ncbi:MAG: rhodanese-like domain-containing protein [Gammaproteobacteria bacterium]|nr:rhodanese-like domain-containing protein [Gammaproteobacteria bacterium]MBU1979264.1 rhodanese-like domain-containing protein [Gammaproteobacteria bacterium]
MRSRLVLALFLLHLAFAALADKPVAPNSVPGTIRVSAEQAVELILANPRMTIIDSRHTEEFAKGHIEAAINLIDTGTNSESLTRLTHGKDYPVLFYCNGERCPRSSNAAKTAVALGYKKVYWFRGGWNEWVDKKLPITK